MFRKYAIPPVLLLIALSLSGFTFLPSSGTGEGNPWFIWLIVFAVLLIFVAFMIWWWIYADKGDDEEVAPVRSAEVEATEPEPDAELEAAAEPVQPDDLKRIEGIGPKISGVLQAAGIATFSQLAAADVEQLKQILVDADPNLLRLADPTSWPEQASHAADGDWEGLEALQDALHGGRHV